MRFTLGFIIPFCRSHNLGEGAFLILRSQLPRVNLMHPKAAIGFPSTHPEAKFEIQENVQAFCADYLSDNKTFDSSKLVALNEGAPQYHQLGSNILGAVFGYAYEVSPDVFRRLTEDDAIAGAASAVGNSALGYRPKIVCSLYTADVEALAMDGMYHGGVQSTLLAFAAYLHEQNKGA